MTAARILAEFPKLRALVAGDICLDRWCRYDPSLASPSRETGIPRVAVVSTEVTPGAAGTVAGNLAALGTGAVAVMGLVGGDGFGFELERALAGRGISTDLLIRAAASPTFTYTKLINRLTGCEDLPRVDFVYAEPLTAELEREFIARLERAAPGYDVILISDQAETDRPGVVTGGVRDALTHIAAANPETVIWVDSRMRAELFRRVIVKANQQEAEAASTRVCGNVDYAELRRRIEAPLLVVTHGGDGAWVVDDRGSTWIPTRRIENPVDICGAGDSFSAGAALALRVTSDPATAVRFGNLVASVTIMQPGTGAATPEQVLDAEK
jgi:rfaE bifunctional protein kinase chain/domain